MFCPIHLQELPTVASTRVSSPQLPSSSTFSTRLALKEIGSLSVVSLYPPDLSLLLDQFKKVETYFSFTTIPRNNYDHLPAQIPFYARHFPGRTATCSTRPRLSLITPASITSKMAPPPGLGALGFTFTVMKAMQFCALVVIIGLSSAFVSDIVASDYAAPPALIGTLVVVSISSEPWFTTIASI